MPQNGSAGASAPPDTGDTGAGGAEGSGGTGGLGTSGILGFFSNFFTYGKEQDIIRTQGDYLKFFQKGTYTSGRNNETFLIIGLVVLLIALLFFFRNK